MSSKQDPWPIPTQPWAAKSEETYKTLAKRTSIEAVLHLTSHQYDTVALFARDWVQRNISGHLNTKKNERSLDQVVQQMKTHRKWGPLFSWVESAGEDEDHVDKAIRRLFRNEKQNNDRLEAKMKTPKQVPTVAQKRDTERSETPEQVPTDPQPSDTELHLHQPVAQHPSTQLEQTLSRNAQTLTHDERPKYLSYIMLVDGENERNRRRVGVKQTAILKDIQYRAAKSWQYWHKISSEDLELKYPIPNTEYFNPLLDEEDWEQALQSARENKKVLEVIVSVPSERVCVQVNHRSRTSSANSEV